MSTITVIDSLDLDQDQVDKINAARLALEAIQEEIKPSNLIDLKISLVTTVSVGRLDEACATAIDALFNVLNVASSRLGSPTAKAGLHLPREEQS